MRKTTLHHQSVILLLAVLAIPWGHTATAADDQSTKYRPEYRQWIEDMKRAPRGPFERIMWFCKDGSKLPPQPYACKERGGGSQHGDWTERTRTLREAGYYIANFYADLDIDAFAATAGTSDALAQMLVEQYLIQADDGWILRKARYYRGAYQEEGERRGARRLLLKLAESPDWLGYRYLMFRTAAGLLAHGADTSSVREVRQISSALADRDPDFVTLRNKIHVSPGPEDAAAVRDYAARLPADDRADYNRLADMIDMTYQSDIDDQLADVQKDTAPLGDLPEVIAKARQRMGGGDLDRFHASAGLLAALRDRATRPNGPLTRLDLVDLSLAVDSEHFVAATNVRDQLDEMSRLQRLNLLSSSVEAVYGAGLITRRQREALHKEIARIGTDTVPLSTYKSSLEYLALLPVWANQQLRLFFDQGMYKLAEIEPEAVLFTQDQLRGSPIFFYAEVIDGLLRDANRMAGIRNELFGRDVGAGLRSLNPGLARGVLRFTEGDLENLDSNGIYVLPETVSDLPPVRGILTAGEGNPLSHVQLLARNLGIPNVGVDVSLLKRLREYEGQSVILAVSPRGSVRLSLDTGQGAELFGGSREEDRAALIQVDLDKLDLSRRDLLTLSDLRSDDSGRVVGPKAAKLGELKHHYPEAVAEGLAIPFGVFRGLLDRPYGDSGRTVFEWLQASYRRIEGLARDSTAHKEATEALRAEVEDLIAAIDPGDAFRSVLTKRMREVFGPDGSYGVFVRSDTNVEDLPGFTGAGLNLTVPNVVGEKNIIAAISRVWASPFTARSFAWRQSLMDKPEHVYPAVLLMLSVNADKSGVLVTQDIDTGDSAWISVAVNEGVGGAVDGQSAESLRINVNTGEVRLLAEATAPIRRRVDPAGGVAKVPVSGADRVLQPGEIAQLIKLVRELPERFPPVTDASGRPAPADIEFGFLGGELRLFQIRPFLESDVARGSAYLQSLDQGLAQQDNVTVDLNAVQ